MSGSTRRWSGWPLGGLAALRYCSSEAVVLIDADFAAVRFDNPAGQALLGHDQGALVGTTAVDLIHPDDQPGALAALSQPGPTPSPPTSDTPASTRPEH